MTNSKFTAICFSTGVALACMIMDIGHSFAEETQNGFNVEFAPSATLSDEELNIVVNIAYQAGIGEITSIQTQGMIFVHEKPIDDKPYQRYRVLPVGSMKFSSEKQQAYYRKLAKRGGRIESPFNDPKNIWSLPGAIRLGQYNEELGQPEYRLIYGSSQYNVRLEEDKLVILTHMLIDH